MVHECMYTYTTRVEVEGSTIVIFTEKSQVFNAPDCLEIKSIAGLHTIPVPGTGYLYVLM